MAKSAAFVETNLQRVFRSWSPRDRALRRCSVNEGVTRVPFVIRAPGGIRSSWRAGETLARKAPETVRVPNKVAQHANLTGTLKMADCFVNFHENT